MLTLRADVVLHADRNWRGNFGQESAGHFDTLRIQPDEQNPLFLSVVATSLTTEGGGHAYNMVPSVMAQLSAKVFPWEQRTLLLPLGFVHGGGFWRPSSHAQLPLLMRKWRWLHVRLDEESTSRWLVWLDEQLSHGRLLG